MSASLLVDERPVIDSGYAWLVSEAKQDFDLDPVRDCGKAASLDEFDELVAEQVVARLGQQEVAWSIRSTGKAVLSVLEQLGWMTRAESPIPTRYLVCRAHRVARQIVPANSWAAQ